MVEKTRFGRTCEDFVAELIAAKTGYEVSNLNDVRYNHPVTDLLARDPKHFGEYEVSVKGKKSASWPAVRGISEKNQYIIFVDIYKIESPNFYILNNQDWQEVLSSILPNRDGGAEIINGALEWNWVESGKNKKFRGSQLYTSDIEKYLNNWAVLPRA
uniref:Uncharacterized protein n=1 Tax=uncultured Thiotrichaceae bacterium TaxID=298394 RepID=A0A6S6UP22_9GAMM|nr:MAG: Unknown protein [uncultured Thiotrichaceae bacterium]